MEHVFEEIFSNFVMLFFYAAFLVFYVVSLVKIYINRRNVRLLPQLSIVLGTVLVWIVVTLLRFTVADDRFIYIFSMLPYALSAFALIAALFLIMRFHNLGVFCQKHILSVCLIVPVMTLVVIYLGYLGTFTDGGMNLIRLEPRIISQHLNYVLGDFGPWHYIRATITDLFAILIFIIAFSQHFMLPKIYRKPSGQMIVGVSFILTGVLITRLNLASGESLPVDFLLIGFIMSIRFLYKSTLGNQGLVFLSQARNDIINHLDQCILILDEEKNITYQNRKASEWLSRLGVRNKSYLSLIELLTQTAVQCEKQSDEESGTDFSFDIDGDSRTYNLREKAVLDNRKRQIGTYVVYSDVTENRALIQRLEVGAGRDALTGLHNRGMMEYLKTELDKPESMPLSVVICDLNDLKKTNDTHGHQQGDIMLRVCGEVLSTRCPPVAQAGRIGGDEFLILLPQTTQQEADDLISMINSHLRMIDEYPYKITMAMGSGVKETADQDLSIAMIAADEAMYENKKLIKGTSRDKAGSTVLI